MERLNISSIDLGKVKLGSKHSFEIKNLSDHRIERVRPACGCTGAIMSSDGTKQVIELTISITKEFPFSVPDHVKDLKQKKTVDIKFSDNYTHTFDINYTLTRNG